MIGHCDEGILLLSGTGNTAIYFSFSFRIRNITRLIKNNIINIKEHLKNTSQNIACLLSYSHDALYSLKFFQVEMSSVLEYCYE